MTDTVGKKVSSPPSPLGSGSSDKKSILSSLKRLVGDNASGSSNNNSNNNGNGSVSMGLEEELDGVERGEGLPLSHLTASRAKAPRRRPPTTQHLRHTAASSATSLTSPGHAASTVSIFSYSLKSFFLFISNLFKFQFFSKENSIFFLNFLLAFN